MEEIRFYIPEELTQFKDKLHEWGVENNFIKYHIDKLIYIIHTLHVKRYRNKTKAKGDYYELNSSMLSERFGRDYTAKILKVLMDNDVIQCDFVKEIGSKSYGYRLSEQYQQSNFISTPPYNLKSKFIENYTEYRFSKKYDLAIATEKKEQDLNLLMERDLKKLSIDFDSAIKQIVNELETSYSLKFKTPIITHKQIKEEQTNTIDRPIQVLTYIKNIKEELESNNLLPQNKLYKFSSTKEITYSIEQLEYDFYSAYEFVISDFYLSRNNRVKRVYTNLTNISKRIRDHVTYQGEKLTIVDVANCQPLLLGMLTVKSFRQKNKPLPTDLQNYIRLCQQGKLYEELAKKHPDYKPEQHQEFKAKVKDQLFRKTFFNKVPLSGYPDNKVAKTFIHLFPTVWEFSSKLRKTNYQDLAIQLQQLESKIMIDGVVKKLKRDSPNRPVWTIHDAIVCRPQDADKYKNKIKEVFAKYKTEVRINQEDLSGYKLPYYGEQLPLF